MPPWVMLEFRSKRVAADTDFRVTACAICRVALYRRHKHPTEEDDGSSDRMNQAGQGVPVRARLMSLQIEC